MKKILIAVILSFSACTAFCSPEVTLEKANLLYQKGDHAGARKEYENTVKSGYVSPELYYNLGNACFKTNNIPAAILNYERAKKLSPDDPDIDFNLRMSNMRVVDKIVPVPEIFYKRWLSDVSSVFSSDKWGTFAIIGFWIAVLWAVLFVLSATASAKRAFFYLGVLFVLITAGSFWMASIQQHALESQDAAIIFDDSIYVKSSPNEKSTDLFILHEGTKVMLADEIDGWKRIKLANGNEGWVPAKSVVVI